MSKSLTEKQLRILRSIQQSTAPGQSKTVQIGGDRLIKTFTEIRALADKGLLTVIERGDRWAEVRLAADLPDQDVTPDPAYYVAMRRDGAGQLRVVRRAGDEELYGFKRKRAAENFALRVGATAYVVTGQFNDLQSPRDHQDLKRAAEELHNQNGE